MSCSLNPPFGKKSSITVVNDEGETDKETVTYNRPDFWTTTSNKQLNFVQHVKSLLKIDGRAAVVVPDNVLFEGGAGEKIRRKLLHECDVHTLLRLSTGIFYAQGVKANVLFFDRKPGAKVAWTKRLWIYDLRTNKEFTLKQRRMTRADLDEFVDCYEPENRNKRKPLWDEQKSPEARWRVFTYEELLARDKVSLDIFWPQATSLSNTRRTCRTRNIPKRRRSPTICGARWSRSRVCSATCSSVPRPLVLPIHEREPERPMFRATTRGGLRHWVRLQCSVADSPVLAELGDQPKHRLRDDCRSCCSVIRRVSPFEDIPVTPRVAASVDYRGSRRTQNG